MTNAQRVAALRKAGVDGVAFVPFHPEIRSGSPRRSSATSFGWLHTASRGRRQLPVRANRSATLAAADAGPALRLPGRADRPGTLPRIRGQQHASPSAHHEVGRRGPGPSSGIPLRRRHRGGGRRPRPVIGCPDRQPVDPRTRCCRPRASTRRRSRSGDHPPRHHQHRGPPTFETGAATIETHIFGLDEDLYGRELRLSFVPPAAGRADLPRRGGAGRPDPGRLRQGQGLVRSLSP